MSRFSAAAVSLGFSLFASSNYYLLRAEAMPQAEATAADESDTSSHAPMSAWRITENRPWKHFIPVTDPNGASLALSLVETEDAEAFEYNAASGELRLRNVQDFERPADANRDNVFDLAFVADDYPQLGALPFGVGVRDMKEIFDETPTLRIYGATPYGGLGRNAVNLGDIDQDGRPDIAIAAPGQHLRDKNFIYAPPAEDNRGEIFILSGSALMNAQTHNLRHSLPAGILRLVGTEDGALLGYSMAVVGDLDDDGLNELAMARTESELVVLSGAILANAMRAGGVSDLESLPRVTITLPDNHFVDPHALAALGDLDEDERPDLGLCMRRGEVSAGSDSFKLVTVLSGARIAAGLESGATLSMTEFFANRAGGYYGAFGLRSDCGRLMVAGDITGDGLTDVAIVNPAQDAQTPWLISGAELQYIMQNGVQRIALSTKDSTRRHTEITEIAAQASNLHIDQFIVELGDINGDEIDDFALSFQQYSSPEELAFIIYGSANLLTHPDPTRRKKSLSGLLASGQALRLVSSGSSGRRLTSVFSVLPPVKGLHDTLMLIRYRLNSSEAGNRDPLLTLTENEIIAGGAAQVSLPIAGAGFISARSAYGGNFSEMISIGDLNYDGYGDLLIGQMLGSHNGPDSGEVWLVSGKALLESRARGEEFSFLAGYQ